MPKTYNNLWDTLLGFDNFFHAFKAAQKGKRFSAEALVYANHAEDMIIEDQNRLMLHSWEPGRWNMFEVYEPKRRLIMAPPFRDRVVHHALVRVIGPLLERKFISDSYACQVGKGTHRAQIRVRSFLREAAAKGRTYALQTDIKSFFPSVNHDVLLKILRRTIRDRDALWLCEKIIRTGPENRGLPIGALTSQLFANVYLDQLDHFVKDTLGIKHYVRYMDDTVIVHHNKRFLWQLGLEIGDFVEGVLDLRLNPKTCVYPISQGVDFCGYRTWPGYTLPRKRNVFKAKRKLKKLIPLVARGRASPETLRGSLASFHGYIKHCQGTITEKSILEDMAAVMAAFLLPERRRGNEDPGLQRQGSV